jgi:F-type H+-transporting ATPase subunit delta
VAQLEKRYANALFELALERGLPGEYLEQALYLREVMRTPDCFGVISHPKISAARKREFLNSVFSGRLHDDLIGFLQLAVSKNRERVIVPALSAFIKIARDHLRTTRAIVISAIPLRDDQRQALAALLSRKLNKQVEINAKVDPSVIGGLYIQADGLYIDRTVKTRLHEMKQSLYANYAEG